ncbi:MAG: carboxypeptidase-like regulatory domain-containing protein [Planctomycetota bacterium]|nr:carboxypeptidase-like regulatory domain-containing protein [Planctomycetota bacterium]MDA1162898.1 carboxypeptidase-like regulatory domain-containing protein [Planctomycetota bacterium]
MKYYECCKSVVVVLASVSIPLSASQLYAGAGIPQSKPSSPTVRQTVPVIQDVSLNVDGALTGFIVDGQGRPIPATRVVIQQGRRTIAETSTNAVGQFQVHELRGGVYQIVHSTDASVFRVWAHGTAPRSARQNALLVVKPQTVRGQSPVGLLASMQPGTLAGIAGGVAGAGVGTVAISEAKDRADAAKRANANSSKGAPPSPQGSVNAQNGNSIAQSNTVSIPNNTANSALLNVDELTDTLN